MTMPRIAKKVPKTRLNLEMTKDVRDRLEALRDAIGADSLGEVVRTALAAYELLFHETQSGGQVVIRSRDGKGPDRHIILVK